MSEASSLTITVVVPTYRRVESLRRCLEALAVQQCPADEVIVTVRDTDEETRAYLEGKHGDAPPAALRLRSVPVWESGVVAAMNAGLAASHGDIVALTDDDAAPHPDWLRRIAAHFAADSTVGGVGGRDFVYIDGRLDGTESDRVGVVTWYGHVFGNHHVGIGGARAVDYLKGVNGAYRTIALRPIGFDTRLRGQGAQVHWELMLGLCLRRRGWRLVYDPAVAVDHFPAIRHDKDQRCVFQKDTHYDIVYNETLSLREYLSPVGRVAFRLWGRIVGTRFAPGALQLARLRLLGKGDAREEAVIRYRATQAARRAGAAALQNRAEATSQAREGLPAHGTQGAADEVGA